MIKTKGGFFGGQGFFQLIRAVWILFQ